MRNKIQYLFMALFTLLAFIAPQINVEASSSKLTKVGLVTDVGGVDDKSFNQTTWEGMKRFGKANGIKVSYLQSKSHSDYSSNLTKMVKQGNGLIFAPGYLLERPVNEIAKKNKKSKFAIIDSVVKQPNVASATFKEHEMGYLAGLAAGLKTKSNKVGFIGGLEVPLIKEFEIGFTAGVKAVNPEAEVTVQYAGSFGDAAKGMSMAKGMYELGVDIIFHAAGGTGEGLFAEANKLKKENPNRYVWVIGIDKDQSENGKDVTLTSAVKRVDNAAYDIATRTKKGKFPGGKTIDYGIKENGVDLAKGKLDSATLKKIEEFKAKIKSGKIKVPSK